MQGGGCNPYWNQCPAHQLLDLKTIPGETRVFPIEFWPEGKEAWGGIRFDSWASYVLAQTTPRP
jgi:hypothetical protein